MPLPASLQSKGRSSDTHLVGSPGKGGAKKDLRIGWVETALGRKWRRHRPGATRGAQPPPGEHYAGWEMPSLFIVFCKVERFIPIAEAAERIST